MERQLKPDYGDCILAPYKDEAAKQSDITNIYNCIDKDTRELSNKILCLECCRGLSCTGTVTQNDISNFITLSDVEALGYTKCIGNITMADVDNCHYTTCTGTVTENQIANFITMVDVDACHFIKSISIDGLCDRICYLEQCPGLNCIGTLVDSDIANFITMHDVLSCGFTTCTGTLVESDLCPINAKITLLESCPGISCTGTVVASDIQDFITKDDLKDCFACKDIENCPGLNCVGTLVQSDISDFITMADVDACCYVKSADISNLDIRVCCLESCAGLSCVGTVVEDDIANFVTYNDICSCFAKKSIENCAGLSCTGTLVASDISSFIDATCAGTIANCCIDATGFADSIDCLQNDVSDIQSIIPSTASSASLLVDQCALDTCGYTTCTGTVVASDIEDFIKVCDIQKYLSCDVCCSIPAECVSGVYVTICSVEYYPNKQRLYICYINTSSLHALNIHNVCDCIKKWSCNYIDGTIKNSTILSVRPLSGNYRDVSNGVSAIRHCLDNLCLIACSRNDSSIPNEMIIQY